MVLVSSTGVIVFSLTCSFEVVVVVVVCPLSTAWLLEVVVVTPLPWSPEVVVVVLRWSPDVVTPPPLVALSEVVVLLGSWLVVEPPADDVEPLEVVNWLEVVELQVFLSPATIDVDLIVLAHS